MKGITNIGGGTLKYEDISGTTTSSGNIAFPHGIPSKNLVGVKELNNNYLAILGMAYAHICINDAALTAVTNTAVTVRVFYLE